MLDFAKCFFCIEMIICFLSFSLLIWAITLMDLCMLSQLCILGKIPVGHGV